MDTSVVWTDYFEGHHENVLRAGLFSAEIMHVCGLSLVALGRFDEAITLFTASLHASPNPTWFNNASVALLDAGKAQDALHFAETGLSQFQDANLLFSAGNACIALGEDRYPEAIQFFSKALELEPTHWDAAMNLGNTLRRMDKNQEAMTFYRRALDNVTDNEAAIRIRLNAAITLSDIGREVEALSILDELANTGVVLSPEMDFNRATLRLKLGDYETGWKLYQRRWDCGMAAEEASHFKKPLLTNLEDAKGKTILFRHEQGFGDSIMFFRYARLLAQEANVIVQCPEPLKRLFAASTALPVVSDEPVEYDFECPMLSAPMLLGTTLETIPSETDFRYLWPPNDGFKDAHAKLGELKDFKVGLVWAGQRRDTPDMVRVDKARSIPAYLMMPLFNIEGVQMVNLQFGEKAMEWDNSVPVFAPQLKGKLLHVLEDHYDFADTAAIIEHLDLVITVDTAVAHLAAALGKPTWVLSRYDGCWRWLKDRSDSPWYPSVGLFRQTQPGDWDTVIRKVEENLRWFSKNKHR